MSTREAVRAIAEEYDWRLLLATTTADHFARFEGEELHAVYDAFGTLGLLDNTFVEFGDTVTRSRTRGESSRLLVYATTWLYERHDPKPKVPFTVDAQGIVSR